MLTPARWGSRARSSRRRVPGQPGGGGHRWQQARRQTKDKGCRNCDISTGCVTLRWLCDLGQSTHSPLAFAPSPQGGKNENPTALRTAIQAPWGFCLLAAGAGMARCGAGPLGMGHAVSPTSAGMRTCSCGLGVAQAPLLSSHAGPTPSAGVCMVQGMSPGCWTKQP